MRSKHNALQADECAETTMQRTYRQTLEFFERADRAERERRARADERARTDKIIRDGIMRLFEAR
jgi:hypothetical protein